MNALPLPAAAAEPVNEGEFRLAASDLAPPRTIPVHLWYPAPVGAPSPARPLLLFFPGWGSEVTENATLLHSLAARGFIVAGVSYPEGRDLPDPKVPMQFTSDAAFAAGRAQGNRMVEIQAQDASRVMDALTGPGASADAVRFIGQVDRKMIGVLGYSLGGAVAAQTALHDRRVRAVMNLDGWMFGDPVTAQFAQPYLVIRDGLAPATAAEMDSSNEFLRHFARLRHSDRLGQDAQLRHSGGWRVTILGSDHFSFPDTAVKGAPGTGTLDPARAREIAAAFAAAFFGEVLRAQPSPLLQGEGPYPEAHLEIFR